MADPTPTPTPTLPVMRDTIIAVQPPTLLSPVPLTPTSVPPLQPPALLTPPPTVTPTLTPVAKSTPADPPAPLSGPQTTATNPTPPPPTPTPPPPLPVGTLTPTPVAQLTDPNTHKPIQWAAPASGNGPTTITVAIATANLPADMTGAITFNGDWSPEFVPLLHAAEHVWEEAANVKFVDVPDSTTAPPDVRVGVSDISAGLNPPKFIEFVHYRWLDTGATEDHFNPDVQLAIQDPTKVRLTLLPDGDYQYTGLPTTVFQVLERGLGTALGLAGTTEDATSIMNTQLGKQNPFPDSRDRDALSAIYGPSSGTLNLSPADDAVLKALMPQS